MMWIILLILFPLFAAALAVRHPKVSGQLMPFVPLPALVFSVLADTGWEPVVLEWVLLESQLGLTPTTAPFLAFSALLWCLAGWMAAALARVESGQRRFTFFWHLALTGNLGLILAMDVITFYSFFALMTFSAYGLVVERATPEARRAGRIYLYLAVMAEAMILVAFLLAAFDAESLSIIDLRGAAVDSPYRNWITGLVLTGFGVKAGIIPLHFWLPLAHPVAPAPASAVLSGTMIKAGLLGWILFLPVAVGGAGWGTTMIGLGMATAVFGVVLGLPQQSPKTVLAYSSVSQMGVMLSVVGLGFSAPELRTTVILIVFYYACNHGLAKGSLFLGTALLASNHSPVQHRHWLLVGLALPAFAIAGAPLTAGATVKSAVSTAYVMVLPPGPSLALGVLLGVSAVGTVALMGRFGVLVFRRLNETTCGGEASSPARPPWLPWSVSVAVALLVPPLMIAWFGLKPEGKPILAAWVDAAWPVVAGVLLLLGLQAWARHHGVLSIPPGEVVSSLASWIRPVGLSASEYAHRKSNHPVSVEGGGLLSKIHTGMSRSEAFLRRREVTAIVLVVLLLLLWSLF